MLYTYSLLDGNAHLLGNSAGPGPEADGTNLRLNLPVHWIHAVNPSPEECRQLSRERHIPLEHIQAALDENERPRLEHSENLLMLVTRIPWQNREKQYALYTTCPFCLIITPEICLTVCLKEHIVEALIGNGLKGSGDRYNARLLLTLLIRTSSFFTDYLRHMNDRVNGIEDTLQSSMQNNELMNLMHIEKSLIYFYTALTGNKRVLEKLAALPGISLTDEEKELLDDAVVENKQATDMAAVFTQILGSISDGFGAVVSNNLNKVMKLLTSLTLLFMIPGTIGSLYGMNVALPFGDNPQAFTAICVACLAVPGMLYFLFRKNNWL